MTVEDARVILGITKAELTEDEIRHAFYDAAHLSHPDNNPQNEYAKTKFAMVQEAYQVLLGFVREAPVNQAENSKETNTNAKNKKYTDRWDAYNEADERFRKMKQEEARRSAYDAIRRQKESERRRKEFEEHLRKSAHQTNEFIHPIDFTKQKESIITTNSFLLRLKQSFEAFLVSDVLYDALLACSVAILLIIEFISNGKIIHLPMRIAQEVSTWVTAILFARRPAKYVMSKWNNFIFSIISFLIVIEVLVVIFNIFLF